MAADDLNLEEDPDTGEKFVRLSEKDAIAQRELARKASDAAEAEERAAKAERLLAIRDAGIPKGVLGDMFVETYKGELTEEAIKEAASKVPGLLAPTENSEGELTPEQQAAAAAEAKQTEERAALARNSTGHQEPPAEDPRKLMVDAVANARQSGVNEQEALARGFSELVNAAGHGDQRARVIMPWDSAGN